MRVEMSLPHSDGVTVTPCVKLLNHSVKCGISHRLKINLVRTQFFIPLIFSLPWRHATAAVVAAAGEASVTDAEEHRSDL